MKKFQTIFLIILLSNIQIIKNRIHNPKNYLICNKANCPKSRGICTRDNKCVCLGDYTTIKEMEGNYQCNYQQTNQSKVFILEFLLGLGAGHFYLGNYTLGFFKFTFAFITFILTGISPCLQYNQIKNKNFLYFINFMGLIYVLWQAIDGILIAINFYKDSNGIPMKNSWNNSK
jgi:hypothetical protein